MRPSKSAPFSCARSVRPVVPLFAVLRKIQALLFILCTHSKPNRLIYDEQDDQGSHNGQSPRDGHADRLVQYLVAVAFEHSGGLACAEGGVDDAVGEDACEQRAEGTARAVYAKRIERVVIAEDGFDLDDHVEADYA